MKALAFLARRFVAGETADGAIAAGRRLAARRIKATFDLLGEDVADREAARRSAEANRQLLRLIPPEVERNISIKLTSMGLDVSRDLGHPERQLGPLIPFARFDHRADAAQQRLRVGTGVGAARLLAHVPHLGAD